MDTNFKNPCENSSLSRLFRARKNIQFKILEKDIVDEIIFRTENQRNRNTGILDISFDTPLIDTIINPAIK